MEQNRKSNFLKIRPANYDNIASLFDRALTKGANSTNILVELLKRKMPIHFGGMSDPFQPIEKKFKLTLKTMNLLSKYKYPTIFSTKSTLIIQKEYLEILKEMENRAVQISLITSDEKIRQRLEPKASSVSDRLKVIKELSNNNIWTSCRIQPLIPFINDNDFNLIDELANAGCKHVVIEHYKLPTFISEKSLKRFNKKCGYDIAAYYRKMRKKPRGIFLELPPSEKIINLKKMAKRIHSRGMTFGAADNDLHDVGDTFCCCGVSTLKGFTKIHTHQITKAVFEGKKSGIITYDLISKEGCPTGSVREIVNYECRQENGVFLRSIQDFIEAKWNTPFKSNAPTEMANVQPCEKADEKGHIIYKHINKFRI